MRTFAFACALLASSAFAKPPTCKERVQALRDLVAAKEKERLAEAAGAHRVPAYQLDKLDDVLSSREGWQQRGFRISASKSAGIVSPAEVAQALNTLTTKATTELCIGQGGPVELKAARAASERELKPLLAMVSDIEPIDRATVLAGEFMDKAPRCKGIKEAFTAVANVAPADRLSILLQSAVESFEACKCSQAELERTFAVLTLMSDVWEDKFVCHKLVAPQKDAAEFKLAGASWDDVAAAIGKAGATGLRFK